METQAAISALIDAVETAHCVEGLPDELEQAVKALEPLVAQKKLIVDLTFDEADAVIEACEQAEEYNAENARDAVDDAERQKYEAWCENQGKVWRRLHEMVTAAQKTEAAK
jgi:hypothetical protein